MRVLFIVFAMFVLSSCAEGELAAHVAKQVSGSPSKSQGTFKVGSPYKVMGKWYRPKETYNFTQTGIASWYGPNFHGKKTANGEIFDQNELTAAHKTLQLPSLVRVTNLENGRSLVVRVNDRGPFSRGRVIDMSKRSAELLGFRRKGTAKVRIDLLSEESQAIAEAAKRGVDTGGTEIAMNEDRLAPVSVEKEILVQPPKEPVFVAEAPSDISGHLENGRFMPDPVVNQVRVTKTNIYVQAGSFSNEGNALSLAEKMRQYNTTTVQTVAVNGQQFHRVRLGPFMNVDQADALLNELAQNGHEAAQIVVD